MQAIAFCLLLNAHMSHIHRLDLSRGKVCATQSMEVLKLKMTRHGMIV